MGRPGEDEDSDRFERTGGSETGLDEGSRHPPGAERDSAQHGGKRPESISGAHLGEPPRRGGRDSNIDGGSDVDPVKHRYDGEFDLYEIATWEVRSPLDRFAVRLTNALEQSRRWLLLSIALSLFIGQLIVATILILEAPILGVLGAASAVPALALALYFWYGDPTTREPLLTLGVTFTLGVVFASVAGVVNSLTLPFFELLGFAGLVLFYFLIVGPIEETVKWLAVRVYAYRTDAFKTVVDGVVYGAMAGVGFAAIENLLYIMMFSVEVTATGFAVQEQEALAIATQRAFVGPGHVIFSAWAGFYLGLAKFNQGKRGPIVVKGLLIASFIHALYNTLVGFVPPNLLAFLGFLVVFHGFWFTLLYRKIRAYRRLYRERQYELGY